MLLTIWFGCFILNLVLAFYRARNTEDGFVFEDMDDFSALIFIILALFITAPISVVYLSGLGIFENFLKGKTLIRGKKSNARI